jgi:hypothetical protein
MSPVRCELGFYIPEDDILHSHCRDNLSFLLPSYFLSFLLHFMFSFTFFIPLFPSFFLPSYLARFLSLLTPSQRSSRLQGMIRRPCTPSDTPLHKEILQRDMG